MVYAAGMLSVEMESGLACKSGQVLNLTGREFLLLSFLIQNKNKIISKERIYEQIWGEYSSRMGRLYRMMGIIEQLSPGCGHSTAPLPNFFPEMQTAITVINTPANEIINIFSLSKLPESLPNSSVTKTPG